MASDPVEREERLLLLGTLGALAVLGGFGGAFLARVFDLNVGPTYALLVAGVFLGWGEARHKPLRTLAYRFYQSVCAPQRGHMLAWLCGITMLVVTLAWIGVVAVAIARVLRTPFAAAQVATAFLALAFAAVFALGALRLLRPEEANLLWIRTVVVRGLALELCALILGAFGASSLLLSFGIFLAPHLENVLAILGVVWSGAAALAAAYQLHLEGAELLADARG